MLEFFVEYNGIRCQFTREKLFIQLKFHWSVLLWSYLGFSLNLSLAIFSTQMLLIRNVINYCGTVFQPSLKMWKSVKLFNTCVNAYFCLSKSIDNIAIDWDEVSVKFWENLQIMYRTVTVLLNSFLRYWSLYLEDKSQYPVEYQLLVL